MEIPHSGIMWCGGKVTSTDYFGLGGQVRAKHMLLVDIALFRQHGEKSDTVVEEFMVGADDSTIRLLVVKRTGD